MGSIPIVKSSAMDSLFEGMPVVIVQDWREVTEEFLEKKYKEFRSVSAGYVEKLYMPYWINELQKYKSAAWVNEVVNGKLKQACVLEKMRQG